mmetsp:Transcript_584/g.1791  ORF Transcript_584/g.1791 Transcript_584/m.1791 type:complete len:291 (-) Transcript_584:197-1069(-)
MPASPQPRPPMATPSHPGCSSRRWPRSAGRTAARPHPSAGPPRPRRSRLEARLLEHEHHGHCNGCGGRCHGHEARAPGRCGGGRDGLGGQVREEQLAHDAHGVRRALHGVPHGPRMRVDLIVIAPLGGFVAEKMDFFHVVEVPEAEGLVPARGEHVEGDLPPDGEGEPQGGPELGSQGGDHLGAHLVLPVVRLKGIALLLGAVAPDGGHVEHAVAELHEGAALHGDLEVRDVLEAEVDQVLDRVLPEVVLDGRLREHLTVLVGDEAVLREEVVELFDAVRAQLALLLDEV